MDWFVQLRSDTQSGIIAGAIILGLALISAIRFLVAIWLETKEE